MCQVNFSVHGEEVMSGEGLSGRAYVKYYGKLCLTET